jgi:hypothetical protein
MLVPWNLKEKGSLGQIGTSDCLLSPSSLLVGRRGASAAIRGNQAADEWFIR